MKGERFIMKIEGPVLCRRFMVKLDGDWYLVNRKPDRYIAEPISGWRVWLWRARLLIPTGRAWRLVR